MTASVQRWEETRSHSWDPGGSGIADGLHLLKTVLWSHSLLRALNKAHGPESWWCQTRLGAAAQKRKSELTFSELAKATC